MTPTVAIPAPLKWATECVCPGYYWSEHEDYPIRIERNALDEWIVWRRCYQPIALTNFPGRIAGLISPKPEL